MPERNKTADVGCVIVGAGHAGTQVATRLRRLGWKKPVTLVGEENTLPYHRPPLSKDYLKGVRDLDSILLAAAAFYEKADIQLRLNRRATRIDRRRKLVEFDAGPPLIYRPGYAESLTTVCRNPGQYPRDTSTTFSMGSPFT